MMFAASCPEMRNNMKENIVLYITGLHSTGSDDDSVEMIYAESIISETESIL